MSALMPQMMTSMSAKASESTEDGLSAAGAALLLLLLLLVGGGPKGGGPPKGLVVLEDIVCDVVVFVGVSTSTFGLDHQGEG